MCMGSLLAVLASSCVMRSYFTIESSVRLRFLMARSRCLNGVKALGALMMPASMADSPMVSSDADFSK